MLELKKDPDTGQYVVYGTRAELHALMTKKEVFDSVFNQIPAEERFWYLYEAFIPATRKLFSSVRTFRDK